MGTFAPQTLTQKCIDPFQFAYRQGRSTVDAIYSLINFILKHLEDHA